MLSSGSFLRQLSEKEGWKSTSNSKLDGVSGAGWEASSKQMQYYGNYASENSGGHGQGQGLVMRKRVMVLVDQSSHSKQAMMWALTHVTNKGDMLTLLQILPPSHQHSSSSSSSSSSSYLPTSLASLCKACKPEVEVEAIVIKGAKPGTVMSQVKKLEVSVLVLGQKKPSPPLLNCLCGGISSSSKTERFVEECINNAECLTLGVRKQSQGIGGYLISTRWHKNFWLLA